jgi:hypothetical protein
MKKFYILILTCFALLGGTAAYTCHENNITFTYQVHGNHVLMTDFSENLTVMSK